MERNQGAEIARERKRWKAVCYENEGFRNTVMTFDQEKNLSRFVYRTAKMNGMKDITLADVEKMLKAADETIFICKGDEQGRREFNGDSRKPTWVMTINRKGMFAAMMTIERSGFAESELREITVRGEKWQQRVWTLA